MRNERNWFLLVWNINFLVSMAYCVICVLRHAPSRKKGQDAEQAPEGAAEKTPGETGTYLLRTFLMILWPVLGPLYFGLGYVLKRTAWFRKMNIEDVVFKKEKIRTYITADENREQKLASIEETLRVGDKRELRDLMMNVLRGNLEHSLGSIAMALNSTDSETSHYAASVLRDELNDFRMRVQQLSEQIQEEPEEESRLETMLFDYMDPILSQNVFSELEQKKYVQIQEQTADQLYGKDPAGMTPERYEALCTRLRESSMKELVEKWTERLAAQYPDELVSYKNQLKLYFMEKDKERFFQTLELLRRSDIAVDQETLEIIRVFQR